jgi:predicted dehydrogenase
MKSFANYSVVVEKPFTATSEEARRVIVAAKKANVILSVYQSEYLICKQAEAVDRRYDSDFLTLKKVIAEGHLGRIHKAEFHHDLPDPPWLSRFPVERTPGSGMAFNAGSHILDQALLLFGLPTSVTAFYRTLRGIESDNEDSYTITLQYGTPLIVHVKTNAVSVMPRVMTQFIRETQGTFINFGADPQLDGLFGPRH